LAGDGPSSLLALFSLILVVANLKIVADTPSKRGLPEIVEQWDKGGRVEPQGLKSLTSILKEAHFLAIAIWFMMRGAALFGFFGLWAGPYLMDTYHLSPYEAGNILSMVGFAMIILSPVLGHLSDKTLSSRKKILFLTSIINFLCWLVMLLFYDRSSIPFLYAIFFLMGATLSSVGPVGMTATKEYFPSYVAGRAMGAVNIFPFLGGILFQPLLGFVLDSGGKNDRSYVPSGYRIVILLLSITSLISLISVSFSKETIIPLSISWGHALRKCKSPQEKMGQRESP
jgi:MFS family permease